MSRLRILSSGAMSGALCAAAFAQAPTAPVVSPRGVINAITQQPAPSRVGPGGIIWINGLNLGPAAGASATGAPLPTQLADPVIQVTINGRPAPLFSVSPGRIVAQVPWETVPGLATIVVKRGDQTSKGAKIFVDNIRPSLRTVDDKGYGSAAATVSGSSLTLSATGLGPTDTRVASGEAASDVVIPRANVFGWIGGSPANAIAALSTTRVGEFDITVDIPADAQPGDMISVVANNNAARAVYQKGSAIDVKYLKMPAGAPDFRGLAASDLKPGFIALSAARDANGCYPSYIFDIGRQKATAVSDCLTIAQPNAPSPFTAANEGAALAAFVGPAPSNPQAPISGNITVFNPGSTGAMSVTLPDAASVILPSEGGNFGALIPSNPPRLVTFDAVTGEVKEAAAGGPGVPGGGGGGFGGLNLLNLTVDLGDGIKEVLTIPTNLGQGNLGVLVGDNVDKPAKAKWAILNAQGAVQSTKDFPASYLPLVPPAAPAGPGGGPGFPGFPGGPGGVNPLARFRTPMYADQTSRQIFVVSTKPDGSKHALVAIPFAAGNPTALEMPDGWFVASCTNAIDVNPIELANRLVLYGTRTLDTTFKAACTASGFLMVDLDAKSVQPIELPGSGQFNAASNAAQSINDYVYSVNIDLQRRTSDTLYVLDGVTASTFRMDLPPDVAAFAGVQPVPVLGALVGLAAKTVPGDAGIVVFDLETASSRLLPTPAGFASVQLMSVLTNQRKIVAKGTKSDNSGSQFLVYDLLNGDLAIVPNPDGVAWVGQAPVQGQPGQPGGGGAAQVPALQRVNAKAAVVEAVTYDAQRKQTGVMSFRIP